MYKIEIPADSEQQARQTESFLNNFLKENGNDALLMLEASYRQIAKKVLIQNEISSERKKVNESPKKSIFKF